MLSIFHKKYAEYRVLEITPTIGCPNNCVYCPQNVLLKKYFANKDNCKQMDFESFCKVLDKLPKNVILSFAGFVEPFMNPYARQMMLEASHRGFIIEVFTTLRNATLEDINAIASIPFEAFLVHLPDKNHAMHLDLTDDYIEKVKLVLEKIPNASFAQFGEPYEVMQNLLQNKLWVTSIILRGNNIDKENIPQNIPLQIESPPDYSHIPIICGREINHSMKSRPYGTREPQPVLLPNGDLVLCCMDYGMQHLLGNIYKQSFDEIWKGEELKRITKALHRETDYPVLCDECEWAIPYNKEQYERYCRTNVYAKGESVSFLNFWKDSWQDNYHYYVQLSFGNRELIKKVLNFKNGRSDYYLFGKKVW